ncbi:phage tail fiber protein [Burkholderia ubonensis]|uniref:phage tail fiber domain-containing protein n=1 Tax=Burkholderia ubonensis TaxID=101571 RepID=UPI0007582097|nr:phage tail fiber protein [Burkholderia ubonensis]KWI10932.1 hypothetical protein WM01_19465 [Burkholderia ubonensis]OJA94431.1 hypothetical protein BGV51_28125 [Burkholderia ubonensis]
MAADYLVPWLKAAGQDGLRNSMMVAQGDNVTKTYTFNFAGGYISKDHVKAYVYDTVVGTTTPQVITPAMWTGPSQLTFGSAFPATQYLVIYRDTPKTKPLVEFKNGAIINEPNLDQMADQSVFTAAETADRFDLVNDGSSLAINNAATALAQSNKAIADSAQATITSASAESTAADAKATAGSAKATADAASATANGIDAKASAALASADNAVATANAASVTANGIDAKATKAQSDAADAVATANTASATANGIDAKATKAQSDAAAAITTSNAASAAANAAKTTAQNALDKSNNAVQRAGDTMTDDLRVKQPNGTAAKGLVFVRQNGTSQAWIHGSMSTGDSYGYSAWATMNPDGSWRSNVITVSGVDNSASLLNARMMGATYMNDRLNITREGWQADLGMRSGLNDNTWTYLRARGGGGFEVINNAYSAVTWAVDDWGNMFTRGMHVMQTNGNLFCQYRNAWMSDILNDLYNRDNGKADRGANCQWNSGIIETAGIRDDIGQTADLPAPYVAVGIRMWVSNWHCLRGVILRNN